MDAFEGLKNAVEGLYDSSCKIIEMKSRRGVINNMAQEVVAENVPCRVCFASSPYGERTATAAALKQGIRLFVPPETKVKAGSRVVVEKKGVETEYICAGQGAVYESHREISLRLGREEA